MQGAEVSYCRKDIMSMCTAPGLKQQKDCRFYIKSTYNSRCMFYRFDEYCDSLDAQMNGAHKPVPAVLAAIPT